MFYHRSSHHTLPEEMVYISEEGRGVLLYIDPATNEGKAFPVLPVEAARQHRNAYPSSTIGPLQGYHQITPGAVRTHLARFERATWLEEAAQMLEEFRAALQYAEDREGIRAS